MVVNDEVTNLHTATLNKRSVSSGNLHFLLALCVAAIFLFAIAGKLLDFPAFLRSVAALGWFPEKYTGLVTVAVLALETTTALLLVVKPSRQFGAFLTVALAAIFCFITINLLWQGVEGDCSCFGVFLKIPRYLSLALDIALLTAGLYLWRDNATSVSDATPKYLLPLSAIFFVASLILLFLIKSNTDLQFHLGNLASDIQASLLQYKPEADPKVSYTAPSLRLRNTDNQPFLWEDKRNPLTILLFVGECTNCAVRRITAWKVLQKTGVPYRLLVVTPDNMTGVKWLQSKIGSDAIVVQDNHRMTSEAYNVKWTPRAYVVDHNKTLLYCQQRIDDLTQAISVTEALLRSRKKP
jgi:hypothetical protein